MIIGTAGHIDHGKTALIRALTGIDTDRLKEEKKRGMSIDLGFAHINLPHGATAGIIDVPGHENFIRNMLAGIQGVDMALLVIAADDGIMPQTREHMDILDLLEIKKAIVVITKIDMVEQSRLEDVKAEIIKTINDRGIQGAPIVPFSAKTGEGLEEIKENRWNINFVLWVDHQTEVNKILNDLHNNFKILDTEISILVAMVGK